MEDRKRKDWNQSIELIWISFVIFCFQLANNSDNLTFHPISGTYLKPVTCETSVRKHWKDQVPCHVLQPCAHWWGRLNLCFAPFDGTFVWVSVYSNSIPNLSYMLITNQRITCEEQMWLTCLLSSLLYQPVLRVSRCFSFNYVPVVPYAVLWDTMCCNN